MKKLMIVYQAVFLLLLFPATAGHTKNITADKKPLFFSNASDYFRSAQPGSWASLSTWESSPDNGITPWIAATLIPDNAANTISIRNTHTVTVSSNQDMDQVVIESGGILFHSANTLTVNDGPGDDVMVQNGGIFTLASAISGNGPVFLASATVNINTGGILRLSATGLTAVGTGVHASNYIYQHAAVLEYTLSLAFSSAGVTFFPNANAATIPVFRITNNIGLIGGIAATTINGLFEANGSISFSNSGQKIFRNGIIGTGNIGHDGTSGKFIINGLTASLGGTGLLTVPAAGMDIGSNTTVTMVSGKTVTGNISLLPNAFVTLGVFNLVMTGDITGGSVTSHVVTDGTGKLVLNNISGATPRIFPVGANTATINPLAIFNGGGFNYGVRVEAGINPAIGVPLSAVNRTWIVRPSGTPGGTVNVNFFYAVGHGNTSFNYAPATVEQGFYTSVWNVVNTGLTQFGGPVNFQVTGTVNIFAADTDAPMVIANLGAILTNYNSVAVHYFTGIKQNNNHILNWKLTCNSTPHVTVELQRSHDGINFIALDNIHATALRCEQPFNYKDDKPAAGINYYRIKLTDADGNISYSSIVSLINAVKGFEIMPVASNPVVNRTVNVKISAAKNTKILLQVNDLQGRVLQTQSVSLFAGFNSVLVNVSQLPAGVYILTGYIADMGSKAVRFVIQ